MSPSSQEAGEEEETFKGTDECGAALDRRHCRGAPAVSATARRGPVRGAAAELLRVTAATHFSHLQTVAATTHDKLDCADAYKHIPVRCYICHNYSTTSEEDPRCVYLGTTPVTTHSPGRRPAAGSSSTRTTPARTSSECC